MVGEWYSTGVRSSNRAGAPVERGATSVTAYSLVSAMPSESTPGICS
jgi:hypothetical protein